MLRSCCWLATLATLATLALACSCTGSSGGTGGGSGGGTGGSGGGGGGAAGPFTSYDLDDAGVGTPYLAMALDPAQQRVGVAYFVNVGRADGGATDNFAVRYVEWKQGVQSAPQTVREVQRTVGISVAFQQNGEPAVSYLGGGSDSSAFWFQSDAVVNYRSGGSTWTERATLTTSDQAPCPGNPPPPTQIGFLVGLWPALVFDGPTAILAFRDAHNGQSVTQDWGSSDVKVSSGGPTNWNTVCPGFADDNTRAYGGRIAMIMASGQPALIFDKATGGAVGVGQNIYFTRRNANLTWTALSTPLTIGNTQSGGSLAYDPVEGFGIAAVERSGDKLQYTSTAHFVDGGVDLSQWNSATQIFGAGTGGWYPSLAMDPIFHEPAVAFYICASDPFIAEGACPASQDELRIIQRVAGTWRETLVDKEGAFLPKLGFFSNGKKAVAYLVPRTGKLRLTVEK